MKPHNKWLPLLTIVTLLVACEDEKESLPSNIVVQFASPSLIVKENSGEHSVQISLGKPAHRDGVITIGFDSTASTNFSTVPLATHGLIDVPVKRGEGGAVIKISPRDNSITDGTRNVGFTIKAVSDGFISGTQTSFTLTVEDNETLEQKESYVNFITGNLSVKEDNASWHEVQLHVSESASANGTIVIRASSDAIYGTHYVTNPALTGDQFTMTVEQGKSVVTFFVKTLDNAHISGNVNLDFEIHKTSGSLKKGVKLNQRFTIVDDELQNKFKGYEVSGGNWNLRKTFEYNEHGQISAIEWESYTPYYRSGTDTYFYNTDNKLIKINTGTGQDLQYYYEENRIVKEEKIENGVVKRYTEFAYDDTGNVGSYRTFHLQSDGSFALSTITVLFYFVDGNLYKKLVYTPTSNPDEPYLNSTETFEHYIDAENPSPMVEVLPNVATQKNLPASYRLETHGHNLLYNFSYEFRTDGKVTKRSTTQGHVTEVASYNYY